MPYWVSRTVRNGLSSFGIGDNEDQNAQDAGAPTSDSPSEDEVGYIVSGESDEYNYALEVHPPPTAAAVPRSQGALGQLQAPPASLPLAPPSAHSHSAATSSGSSAPRRSALTVQRIRRGIKGITHRFDLIYLSRPLPEARGYQSRTSRLLQAQDVPRPAFPPTKLPAVRTHDHCVSGPTASTQRASLNDNRRTRPLQRRGAFYRDSHPEIFNYPEWIESDDNTRAGPSSAPAHVQTQVSQLLRDPAARMEIIRQLQLEGNSILLRPDFPNGMPLLSLINTSQLRGDADWEGGIKPADWERTRTPARADDAADSQDEGFEPSDDSEEEDPQPSVPLSQPSEGTSSPIRHPSPPTHISQGTQAGQYRGRSHSHSRSQSETRRRATSPRSTAQGRLSARRSAIPQNASALAHEPAQPPRESSPPLGELESDYLPLEYTAQALAAVTQALPSSPRLVPVAELLRIGAVPPEAGGSSSDTAPTDIDTFMGNIASTEPDSSTSRAIPPEAGPSTCDYAIPEVTPRASSSQEVRRSARKRSREDDVPTVEGAPSQNKKRKRRQ
ncbi:predicted protein [Postia placenta Mad-698-R]|nr:predicted protein [Postia placenta Mad-698-R]